MPSNVVKSIADKTKKAASTIEKLWDKAKEIAAKKMSVSNKYYWPTVTQITKRLAGIKESYDFKNLADFILLEDTAENVIGEIEKSTHLSTALALLDDVIFVDVEKFKAALQDSGLKVKSVKYFEKNNGDITPSKLVLDLDESVQSEQLEATLENATVTLFNILYCDIEEEKRKALPKIFKFEYDLPDEGNSIDTLTLACNKYDFVLNVDLENTAEAN